MGWPRLFQDFKVPRFHDNGHDGGKVDSLKHRPPLTQQIIQLLISNRVCVEPRAKMQSEEIHFKKKFPLTPTGIETATLRFVVQHLNHCTTAVTKIRKQYLIYKTIFNLKYNILKLINFSCS